MAPDATRPDRPQPQEAVPNRMPVYGYTGPSLLLLGPLQGSYAAEEWVKRLDRSIYSGSYSTRGFQDISNYPTAVRTEGPPNNKDV